MKSRFPGAICLLCWLAVLAIPLRLAAEDQKSEHVRYSVIDLGTFGGPGTNSSAYDMNNAGWVAGSANLTAGGPQHAFLWYGSGPLLDLGTLGGPNSEAGGPNLRGEGAILAETAETETAEAETAEAADEAVADAPADGEDGDSAEASEK